MAKPNDRQSRPPEDKGLTDRLRLRHRIMLGYLVPVIILVVVAMAVYTAADAAAERAEQQAAVERNSLEVFDIANAFEQVLASNRGFVGTQDPAYLEGYDELVESLQADLASLANELDSPASREALREAAVEVENYLEIAQRARALAAAGEEQNATKLLTTEGLATARSTRESLDRLIDLEVELSALTRAKTNEALRILTNAVVGATLLGILLALGVGYLVASRASRDIEASTLVLSETSSDMAATAAQHERMANQQAAAVSETTATMTELSSSARQTDEQAQEATEQAQRALSLSETGADAMRQTLKAVTALRERIEKMNDEVDELRDETNQIGAVTDLVRDIADQTNMLAINASVEAARAGEHGRGFAVVAAEIRKLSDESRRSADRIAGHLTDIQRSANATGRVAEEGARTLREVVELTQRSADAFRGVSEAVNEAYERTQQISHSARQQSAAVQQVVEAMESASAGVRETAAGVRQTKAGIERLETVAVDLRRVV